jgi:TonB family protein
VSGSSTDKASGESRTPRPNLIHKVEPVYPAAARKEKLVGAVVIELTVATSGEVTVARVVRGHPAFNDAAVSALKQWRYAALEQGPMKLQITVVFRPD